MCATGGEDRAICLWETTEGKLLSRTPGAHGSGVTTLVFTPSGQLISTGKDRRLIVWNFVEGGEGGKTLRSEEHTSELQSRQYLPPFPTRRSSDLDVRDRRRGPGHLPVGDDRGQVAEPDSRRPRIGSDHAGVHPLGATDFDWQGSPVDRVELRRGRRGRQDAEIGRAHV